MCTNRRSSLVHKHQSDPQMSKSTIHSLYWWSVYIHHRLKVKNKLEARLGLWSKERLRVAGEAEALKGL